MQDLINNNSSKLKGKKATLPQEKMIVWWQLQLTSTMVIQRKKCTLLLAKESTFPSMELS